MADKFDPPVIPSIESAVSTEAVTLESNFGDGYSQRSGAGLNGIRPKWQAVWSALTISQADQIETFFVSRRGFHAFEWQSPRDRQPQLYRCKKWDRGFVSHGVDSLRAEIEKVFDL
ncbi:UNVERIFIED_ORG: phage-related protein [Martelella mediterranea]